MCVGMWGILAGVYVLAVKDWVFHLGLAFLRSCFVLCYHIFVWRVCLFVFFFFPFFCRCFQVHLVVNLQAAVPPDDHHLRALADSLPDVTLAGRASSTAIKYSATYARWKRWARDHDLPAFPASLYHFALYLKTASPIESAVHGIAWVHLLAGERSLSEYPLVKDVLAGAQRLFGPPYFQEGTYYRCSTGTIS